MEKNKPTSSVNSPVDSFLQNIHFFRSVDERNLFDGDWTRTWNAVAF
jgi:hypothetical protein